MNELELLRTIHSGESLRTPLSFYQVGERAAVRKAECRQRIEALRELNAADDGRRHSSLVNIFTERFFAGGY